MKKESILLFIALISLSAISQENLKIHIGAGIPISDFGNENYSEDYSGGAAVGINLGLSYNYPLTEELGLFARADVNINGLNEDFKKDVENTVSFSGILNPDVKHSKYINIPLSVGIKYEIDLMQSLSLFINGGVSLNFYKVTDFKVVYPNSEMSVSYELDNNVGFMFGGGINLTDNICMELDYFALGKHSADGEIEIPGIGSINTDVDTKVDILVLSLGYRF
jgi:hypothetical protein